MSRLYATIDSDSRKTQPTSRGHRHITTHAATWQGAVRVSLSAGEGGTDYIVELVPWHGRGEHKLLAEGVIEDQ